MKMKVYGSLGRTRCGEEDDKDVDSGWAWIVLFASFMANGIILGSSFAFSVFYAEWIECFHKGPTATSLLISISCALILGTSAPATILANRFGARRIIMLGGLLSATGFAASAVVPSFEWLYVTYGLMAGLGNGLALIPSFGVLSLYFRERRNFATSVVTVGTGVGIMIFSLLFEYLIASYTWRGAMLITAGILLNVIPCGAVMSKRLPHFQNSGLSQYAEFSLFKEPSFCASMIHFLLMGSHFVFVVFCLQYALVTFRIPKEQGAWVVTVMGATNIGGRVFVAVLSISHKFATANRRFVLLHFSSLCVAVATFCYSLCETFVMACVVSGLLGLSWGTKFALMPGIQMDISTAKRFNAAWGYLTLVSGISYFALPPLAGEIMKMTGNFASVFYFAGLMSLAAFFVCPILHGLWWSKRSVDTGEKKSLLDLEIR
ncbi:hypothetical protein RvY_18536 [Ramazzottius varieornatus]|uniref:Major facilitator superfamily (MFS) profile domain-containing protein n=1 Tax=Ramazzottius varieornatus TaxID=947166 RepID=A0A1D1W668_RAMVA|nr:hypothetical protein RvY_18536 [Ramazzottius varieornatus]